MAKKIRKKNSSERRYRRFSELTLKNYALIWAGESDGVVVYSVSAEKKTTMTSVVFTAITTVPYRWHINVAVLCRDNFGKDYTQGVWILSKDKYFHHELEDMLISEHEKLLKTVNPAHLVSVAWIAVPTSGELTDEKSMSLLIKAGGFDAFAQWELNENEKEKSND